jgi:hypothetical protein
MDNPVYTSVCRGSQGPPAYIEADGQTGCPLGGATAPRTEAGGQTATPGGPTASRRHAAAQSCAPPAVAVVEVVVVARRTTATSR